MNILEALNYLTKNNYILESAVLNPLATKHVGYNYEQNKKAFAINGRDNASFKDPEYYNDREGIIWTYINKRDELTLKLAFLDGSSDTTSNEKMKEEYNAISTEEELDAYIKKYHLESDYQRGYYFIKKYLNAAEQTKYTGRGIKVYRGLRISLDDWKKIMDNNPPRNAQELISRIDNTTKQFNSFSVDQSISMSFARGEMFSKNEENSNNNVVSIVFSGYAEPNDINYAFSMYLYGRHHFSESELNLNNRKKLKDLKIELYRNPIEIEKQYNKISLKTKPISLYTLTPQNRNAELDIVFGENGYAGVKIKEKQNITEICRVIGNKETGILIPDDNPTYFIVYNTKANRSVIYCPEDSSFTVKDVIANFKITKMGKHYVYEIGYDNGKDVILFDDDEYEFIHYGYFSKDDTISLLITKDRKFIVNCEGVYSYGACYLHKDCDTKYKAYITGKIKNGILITGSYHDTDISYLEYSDEELAEMQYEDDYGELEPYQIYESVNEYLDLHSTYPWICILAIKK